MNIKPEFKTIFDLLDPRDRTTFYTIPRYQREYTWDKGKWDALFDDLTENNSGYYIGSIILIDRSGEVTGPASIELVDGQQRLITISLLLIAIFHTLDEFIKSNEDMVEDDLRAELSVLKSKLVQKRQQDKSRIVLQIQNNNNDDYEAVLKEVNLFSNQVKTPIDADKRLIFKSYRHLKDRIYNFLETTNETKMEEKILNLLDKVYKVRVISIQAASGDDAYLLFESLNNRGMALSPVDLIKNKLLAKLKPNDQNESDSYYEQWTKLIYYLGEDVGIQERFLAQHYNAFREEIYPICKKPVAMRSNLIDIYARMINQNAEKFLNDIVRSGEVYSQILLRQEIKFDSLRKPIEALHRIQGAPSYVLVLYLLMKYSDHKLDENNLANIIYLLVTFFVRRNLTDIPPTRDLRNIFVRIIGELKGKTSNEVTDYINSILQEKTATDDEFRKKMKGPIYTDNSSVTRFILCSLEEQNKTRETMIDLWRKENNKLIFTIEHILPQRDNLPNYWVDMVAGGDKDKAKELQEKYVHLIGNLTITGYNSELGSKSFIDKRDRKDSNGNPVGYKNGLILNEDLKDKNSWGVQQIELRTEKLVNEAINIFHF